MGKGLRKQFPRKCIRRLPDCPGAHRSSFGRCRLADERWVLKGAPIACWVDVVAQKGADTQNAIPPGAMWIIKKKETYRLAENDGLEAEGAELPRKKGTVTASSGLPTYISSINGERKLRRSKKPAAHQPYCRVGQPTSHQPTRIYCQPKLRCSKLRSITSTHRRGSNLRSENKSDMGSIREPQKSNI